MKGFQQTSISPLIDESDVFNVTLRNYNDLECKVKKHSKPTKQNYAIIKGLQNQSKNDFESTFVYPFSQKSTYMRYIKLLYNLRKSPYKWPKTTNVFKDSKRILKKRFVSQYKLKEYFFTSRIIPNKIKCTYTKRRSWVFEVIDEWLLSLSKKLVKKETAGKIISAGFDKIIYIKLCINCCMVKQFKHNELTLCVECKKKKHVINSSKKRKKIVCKFSRTNVFTF